MEILFFIIFLVFLYFVCMLVFHKKFREWMLSEIKDTIYNAKFHRVNSEIYSTKKSISFNEKQIQHLLFRIEELNKDLSLKYAEIDIIKEKINSLGSSEYKFNENILNSIIYSQNIDAANKAADELITNINNNKVVKVERPLMFNPENSSPEVNEGNDCFNPELSIKLHNDENED